MRIAILGSGTMGGTLGPMLAAAGHRVTFSYSRDPAKLERLARAGGPRARAATPKDAVRDADVVVLTVRWQQVGPVLRLAGSLRGKVLIDACNPLTLSDDALAVGHHTSGAEVVARKARGALVVKAFNTITSELLRAGIDVLGEQPSGFYCTDHQRAGRAASRLLRDLGFAPVNCGALTNARYLEPLAMLTGELAYNQGRRPEIGLRVLRPKTRR